MSRWPLIGAIILSLTSCFMVAAQSFDPDAEQKGYGSVEQGNDLVSIVVQPEGEQVRLYITGKKAAGIKVDDATIEATVGNNKTPISVIKMKDQESNRNYYLLKDLKRPVKNLNIQVEAGEKSQDFHIPELE